MSTPPSEPHERPRPRRLALEWLADLKAGSRAFKGVTVPPPEEPEEPEGRRRGAYEKDVARIKYAPEWMRLAGVTQMVAPGAARSTHDRLLHSIKVGDLAAAFAGVAKALMDERKVAAGVRALPRNSVHPSVAQAAGIAHDIGHPPFGHLGEEALDEWLWDKQQDLGLANGRVRFHGNAQTYRVLTRLTVKRNGGGAGGLLLTNATLAATLKYPWPLDPGREPRSATSSKCGYYPEDAATAEAVLAEMGMERPRKGDRIVPTLEAQLMDWADTLTYAAHDMADFIRVGLVQIDHLAAEARTFLDSGDPLNPRRSTIFHRALRDAPSSIDADSWRTMMESHWRLDHAQINKVRSRRGGAAIQSSALSLPLMWAERHSLSEDPDGGVSSLEALDNGFVQLQERLSGWVSDLIEAVEEAFAFTAEGPALRLVVNGEMDAYVASLKAITKEIVVDNPALGLAQFSQKQTIRRLCGGVWELLEENLDRPQRLPPRLTHYYVLARDDLSVLNATQNVTPHQEALDIEAKLMAVRDYVASLTDQFALDMMSALEGSAPLSQVSGVLHSV